MDATNGDESAQCSQAFKPNCQVASLSTFLTVNHRGDDDQRREPRLVQSNSDSKNQNAAII
ncbi:hypothetical protein RBWH47_00906 [Rhodopirellula baltica WH47]|uniref:Uncharacterized protein n=1 Tax=Rhodopirellula baltica WH47 TaxID=991778 RepID=F2AQF3_RHOBT|nr:hypothetical protein RBWH47_00906 [Rhodopirellula baltica WH47]